MVREVEAELSQHSGTVLTARSSKSSVHGKEVMALHTVVKLATLLQSLTPSTSPQLARTFTVWSSPNVRPVSV